MATGDHQRDWAEWEAELAGSEEAALRDYHRATLRGRVLTGVAALTVLAMLAGALLFTARLGPERPHSPGAPPPTASSTSSAAAPDTAPDTAPAAPPDTAPATAPPSAPTTTKPPDSRPSLPGGR